MSSHFPHGAGGAEDVIVGHLLVDRECDAGLQDRLYLRSVVLRKVHRRQSHLAYWPAAGEEAVLLEHRLTMQRHRYVTGAACNALGRERFHEFGPVAAECLWADAHVIKPIDTPVVGM